MDDTISIHALHEESDHPPTCRLSRNQFQSTLSMRRAITFCHGLSPCEYISIHALHEESEIESDREDFAELNFNPRSP